MSTGRVDLIRLEATKHARANNVLTSGPKASLPIRNSRSCNALAFCDTDPNYLAVGLDKVRGDCSLVIWDINTMYPSLSLPAALGLSLPSRPQPQIPRGEIPHRIDPKILQQHASTEIVSCLSFLPQSTNLLLAGISHRWLRLFDLRSSVPSTTNVPSKVQGIATDPFDPNRFGCFGDNVVTIWDARKLPHPLVTFSEKDAMADGARIRPNSSYASIEFSRSRRGTLATLEKDSGYVRFWSLTQAQAYTRESSSDGKDVSSMSNRATRMSWANLPWTAGSNAFPQPPREPEIASLVLSNTRRSGRSHLLFHSYSGESDILHIAKNFLPSLSSFALVPSSRAHPLASNVMVVNRDGDLELYSIYDTPKQAAWSPRGDLALGVGLSCKVITGFHQTGPPPDPWDTSSSPHYEYDESTGSQRGTVVGRGESIIRGRAPGKPNNPMPLFGRGDEDGFPALSTSTPVLAPANLAATRPAGSGDIKLKIRGYSPSSMRNFGRRLNSIASRSRSRQPPDAEASSHHETTPSKTRPRLEARGQDKNSSTSRNDRKQHVSKTINRVVEEDVSMTMRRRAVLGYGVSNVRLSRFFRKRYGSSTTSLSRSPNIMSL